MDYTDFIKDQRMGVSSDLKDTKKKHWLPIVQERAI